MLIFGKNLNHPHRKKSNEKETTPPFCDCFCSLSPLISLPTSPVLGLLLFLVKIQGFRNRRKPGREGSLKRVHSPFEELRLQIFKWGKMGFGKWCLSSRGKGKLTSPTPILLFVNDLATVFWMEDLYLTSCPLPFQIQ